MKILGNLALLGQGYVYQVLDISDPAQPTILYDTTLTEQIFDITIQDSVLFILMNRTVVFADARNPFPLREFGRFTAPLYGLRHISVSDTFMYLLPDWALGFAVSIAQLTNPYILTWFPVGNSTGYEGRITAQGRFVYYQPYCPCAYYVLEYLPDSSYFRYRSIGGFVGGYHSVVADTLLLIGTLTDFRAYNISNQWIPVLVGSLDVGSPIRSVAVKGTRVYAGTEDSGVITISISNPASPTVVARSLSAITGKFSVGGSVLAVASVPDIGLSAPMPGLHLYDTAGSDSLTHLHHFPTPYPPAYDITLRGNIGFSNYSNGIWSVDYSDVNNPRALRHTLIRTRSQFARSGDYVCFLSGSNDAQTFVVGRLGDSGSVAVLSQTPFSGTVYALDARDTLVFVLGIDSLSILSIADPASPRNVGKWQHGNTAGASDISVAGNFAYVSLRQGAHGGLTTLDVSNPLWPQPVAHIFSNSFGILARDTVAYACTTTTFVGGVLNLLSVSDPYLPRLLSTLDVPTSRRMVRSGDFLYMLHQGLNAIDVSDPINPERAGEIPAPNLSSSSGLAVRSDTLFIANSEWNIGILKHDHTTSMDILSNLLPSHARLFQNHPNPFNPETRITFELPTRGRTTLTVYDVLGRVVSVLVDEVLDPGRHAITWNSGGIAAGVYFYQLRTGYGTVNTKRMIFLK